LTQLKLIAQIKLFFNADHAEEVHKTRVNLSAIIFSGSDYLWCGTDEYTKIERLTRSKEDPNTFSDHQVYQLRDLIPNFDESEGELDIEGLDYQDGYLWFIGSHSTKRKKSKGDIVTKGRLKDVIQEPNRYFLARIPLNEQSELVNTDGTRKIGWLPRYSLTEMLKKDPYLGSIIKSKLPGKDNGFDIEGLAVHNQRVFIGLRGPVLRGIAVMIEIEIAKQSGNELKLKKINDSNSFYRLHFLDLAGSGIRELCFDGDELLVIAGPTMDLDGLITLYRLKQVLNLPENSLSNLENQRLEILGEIPHATQSDRAEGLAVYPQEDDLLCVAVVYDRPKSERLLEETGVFGDIFQIDCE